MSFKMQKQIADLEATVAALTEERETIHSRVEELARRINAISGIDFSDDFKIPPFPAILKRYGHQPPEGM